MNQQAPWRAWSNICDAGTNRIGGSEIAEKQTLSRFISALSVEHHISLGAGISRPDIVMNTDNAVFMEASAGISGRWRIKIQRID